MGSSKPEFDDLLISRGGSYSGCLCSNKALKINRGQKERFNNLGLYDGRFNPYEGFVGKRIDPSGTAHTSPVNSNLLRYSKKSSSIFEKDFSFLKKEMTSSLNFRSV